MTIKPLEKQDKNLLLKIIFILVLIIAALFLSKLYSNKNKSSFSETSSQKKVLGETIKNIKEILPTNINKTVKKVEETTGEVLGEVTNLLTNSASKSAQTVTDFLFENTVGKVVEQIEKLPQKQQEEIKKRICK